MGTIRINGSTSGYVELVAPATAGTTTVTLPSSSTSLVNATPFGAVIPFAGSTAPDGWLLCYGQAISRTTYASLFAVISTTYGTGDGSTTFNVPDLRGRVAAGVDNMGGSDAGRLDWANSLNTTGGEQKHTLTTAEIPGHTHPNTLSDPGHTHSINNGAIRDPGGSTWAIPPTNTGGNLTGPLGGGIFGTNSGTTGITITNAQNTGGGGAHNVMQPTILLNYIIKAL